jgi:hypothetical protein
MTYRWLKARAWQRRFWPQAESSAGENRFSA